MKLYSKRSAFGGFSGTNYWSSTDTNADGAWGQNFGDGGQGGNGYSSKLCVRAFIY